MVTASGQARSTTTCSACGNVATRAAIAGRSCRASGTPSGTAAFAVTSALDRVLSPLIWTRWAASTVENPTSQTRPATSASTSTPTSTNGQVRRRRGRRLRLPSATDGGLVCVVALIRGPAHGAVPARPPLGPEGVDDQRRDLGHVAATDADH